MSDPNEQQGGNREEREGREGVDVTVNVPQPAQPFANLAAANAEIQRLRGESARRRTERNDARARLTELEQQTTEAQQTAQQTAHRLARLEAAAKAGVSLEQLDAAEQLAAATSAEDITAAQERLARASTTQPTSTARNPTPPREPTQPPSREEQIRAAEDGGNYREAMRLKAQEMANQQEP